MMLFWNTNMTQMAKHDMCVSLRPSMSAINHPIMNLDTANPEFLFKNVDVFFVSAW